ncbi:MAG: hypothetical protein ACLQL2_11955 [Methylovirgula sp.]
MSGVALAALLTTGSVAAKADESNAELAAEIHALKAQLRHLEAAVDKHSVQIHAVQVKAASYQATAPGAYEPPVPWDKKFHLNGITITPGGFLAAEGVYRTRDTGGDFSPAFGSLNPYSSPLAHLNEIRGTARQSRVSLLVQGNYNPDTLISGYGELDFLGAAPTANSNESNSYTPRIRHLYGTIDWLGEGFHLLAGQTWSLVTMNQKGITPRNEDIPLTIDAQYVAGFTWTRQPQIRLVKNFGDQFWIAASAEMPQTTGCPSGVASGTATPGVNVPIASVNGNGVYCEQYPSGGSGVLNPYNYYSFNHIPDVVAKAALEENIDGHALHVEGYGLYTDLYDLVTNGVTGAAVSYNNSRYDTTGWGAGGGFTLAVLPKLLDIQGSAMIGRGIGRYGSSQLADATFNPNGSLDPLPEVMFLGGAVVHATPQLDLYAYGGEEKILSTDWNSAAGTGYASPTLDNSGCYILNGTCKGKVQDAWEITGGFWDKVYQGSFGSVRVGLQYAYIQDDLFAGSGTSDSGLAGGLPANAKVHFNDNMVYASFRYYPFDPAPPAPPVVAKY